MIRLRVGAVLYANDLWDFSDGAVVERAGEQYLKWNNIWRKLTDGAGHKVIVGPGIHSYDLAPFPSMPVTLVADDQHGVTSVSGWHCDICGIVVNGQTDGEGIPLVRGDAVYHTP